jgi:dihydrodipicolinate synthase/N-acetylneuraminate lyase
VKLGILLRKLTTSASSKQKMMVISEKTNKIKKIKQILTPAADLIHSNPVPTTPKVALVSKNHTIKSQPRLPLSAVAVQPESILNVANLAQ